MHVKGELLLQTTDVRVRVMTLQPGEATARHHHSVITDHMVGLQGEISVELSQPAEVVPLAPGQRCTVAPGRTHRVINGDPTAAASYLLVQGVGPYDFIDEEG